MFCEASGSPTPEALLCLVIVPPLGSWPAHQASAEMRHAARESPFQKRLFILSQRSGSLRGSRLGDGLGCRKTTGIFQGTPRLLQAGVATVGGQYSRTWSLDRCKR